jgi:pimeloyl-ACP methyl ester carboxylesterase
MPKVQLSNGVTTHYQQMGEGPDLVMIHGLTGNLAVWHLKIVPLLMDRFRVLCYDLRGHGYSSMTPTGYTADDLAGDLTLLLDELEIDQPMIVGHSYGADVALYFSLAHPERVEQVVAIEAGLPALVHERSRDEWAGWNAWAAALDACGIEVPPERRSDVQWLVRTSLDIPKKWGPLNGLPRNPKKFLKLLDETTMSSDYEHVGSLTLDRLADVDVPVVAMYSEDTAFTHAHDVLVQRLPRCRSLLLPATEFGHFGPLEQPELVSQHIIDLAAEVPQS